MIPSVVRPPGLIVGRASRAGVIALSIIALILGGCRGDEASLPSEPAELSLAGKGNCPGDAIQLINALFSRGLRNAITQQCNNIERQFSLGKNDDALSKLESLIATILEHQEEGQTNDTTGPLGFGSGEAVLRLIGELNEIVGQPGLDGLPPGIDPFAPAGAVEVCQAGQTCEIVGGDEFSGILIPGNVQYLLNGLPYDGPVTIYIAALPSDESPFPGFTLGETTFPLFRFFGSIPDRLEFIGEVVGVVCVLDPPHSLAPDPEDIPDLRLAHLENGVVVPLPLRDASGLVNCTGVNATVPEEAALWRGAVDALLGPAAWFLDVPPLYAKPGALGGRVSAFSPFGAVLPDIPEGFTDGFEDALNWTPTGFWNRTTGTDIVNEAVPTYVTLAPDDESGGALPAAPEGNWYIWYGVPADGNYIGTQIPEDGFGSGGTSTTANSGSITSPAFVVPSSLTNPTLTFDTWFEIESEAPSGFDLMTVNIIDVVAETVTELGRLNPASSPGGSPPLPFTSSGFNEAPVFVTSSFSLSDFSGRTVQIVLTFNTGDAQFNGFRGWIVDDVQVVEGSIVQGLSPASIRRTSEATNRARCGDSVCLSFPVRRRH